MRIPLTPDLHINEFSGGTITELESGTTNGVIEKNDSGFYLTQRPGIDIFADASATVAKVKGRGVYYWNYNSDIYFVNDDTIYKGSYASSIGTITSGTKRCYFFSVGTRLVVLDPANDQGWTVTSGGTLAQITDVDFPPKQTPAIGLAHGGADLDGYLFVLGEDGTIYNSSLEDATAWNALDYISAERDPDGGVYLAKHHDHLVAFGPKSAEFFYNAANVTGSPLARRQDVFYSIGCADGNSCWENGDRLFFAGTNSDGAIGIYLLDNFNITKISTPTIDSFISQAIVKDGYSIVGSGLTAQGHTFYLMTLYTLSGSIVAETTLCFDAATAKWGTWETGAGSITEFPIISSTLRTGITPRYSEAIFSNGDLFSINDALNPQDTVLASTYVVTDYVETGYITESAAVGTDISLIARTGQYDGGIKNKKRMQSLAAIGETTQSAQTLTIKWSNENSRNFNAGKSVDTSQFQTITRMGSFRRRNFQAEYAGTDQVRLQALEGEIIAGNK